MKILVDIMGGDNAPVETLKGACLAAREYPAEYVLIGDEEQIKQAAAAHALDLTPFTIVHTTEIVTMEDDPLCIRRAKAESSMAVGLRMLAAGEGDAFVSTGNTGALFTGATLIVRKIRGIQRPALATILPGKTPVMLLDSGANVVVEASYLEQFALMGSIYMKKMYSLKSPRVGLLNNGAESCKGTPLQIEAYQRLSAMDSIHFVGNVEANRFAFGVCDVLVTDGFTGNILLKGVEGVGKLVFRLLRDTLQSSFLTHVAAAMIRKPLYAMKKQLDANEYGGAPLLGITRPVIKAHGSSNAKAFKNAIRQALQYAQSGMIDEITKEAARIEERRKKEKEREVAAAQTTGAE